MKAFYLHGDKIMALSAPVTPVIEEAKETQYTYADILPFGNDNLFPNALIELKRNSAVHAAIIHSKKVFIIGKGITTTSTKLQALVNNINTTESLRDVVSKIAYDLILYGNATFEVVKVKGGGVVFFHKDFHNFRLSKDENTIIYNPKWSQRLKNVDKPYTLWPKFSLVDKEQRSIVHIKQYEPGQKYYGLPDYIAGMNAATILYKTDKWNLSRLDNSFKPSGLLLVNGELSDAERKQFEEDWNAKFSGEEKQGQVMKIVNDMAAEKVKFIPLNDAYDADWREQQAISEGNVVTAHGWFRSLSGLADNTGFDTQRILQEYQIALNTIISDFQELILSPMRRVFSTELKLNITDIDLAFINEPPVTIAGLVEVNKVLKVWEGRKLIGVDFDETDITQQGIINDNSIGSKGDSAKP